MTRNPKDCVTSLHRFLTGSNPNAKDNWSEVFDQFLTDESKFSLKMNVIGGDIFNLFN